MRLRISRPALALTVAAAVGSMLVPGVATAVDQTPLTLTLALAPADPTALATPPGR
ncbi:MAG: hypothetical protein JWM93_3588, partial [Frankiales bacterium]|nr:hypothetical protein [Frankiales bacterium]